MNNLDFNDPNLLPACSIGEALNSECHSKSYTVERSFYPFTEFSADDKFAILRRTGLAESSVINLCSHHKCMFVQYYHSNQRTCCDPFLRHRHTKKKVKGQLRPISIEMALRTSVVSLVPGRKLCCNCRASLAVPKQPPQTSSPPLLDDEYSEAYSGSSEDSEDEQSPVKKDRMDSEALLSLMSSIRERIALSESYEERISLLTLAPSHWSRQMMCERFGVTDYMARQARKLRDERGVLAKRDAKTGRQTSQDVVASVHEMYEDIEYSKMCPGVRDFVPIRNSEGEKVLHQKRLMLMNLKELYTAWKARRGDLQACGFSLFASLRPKWCVLAGASGILL